MRSYVRGKYAKASVALIRELSRQGIASNVGYASDRRLRDNTLQAHVRAENVWRVPREWQGFKVVVHVDNELRDRTA